MPRKLIVIDDDVFTALEELADARMASVQELADEALTDLLKKHGRPVGLRDALRESTQSASEQPPSGKRR